MTGELTSGWLAAEDLTEPETALVDAALGHRPWRPRPGRRERTVRAQVLFQLLTGQGGPAADRRDWETPPRAVRVRGAQIVGQLDVDAATLRCPLELVGCWLDYDAAPVLLAEATAPAIRLLGCWLPAGLNARQVTTRGDFDLRGCRVHGEVRISGGRVGGSLRLNGGKFRNEGGTALAADRLRVEQGIFFRDGFEADGEVRLVGVQVGGSLTLAGKFRNEGGTALAADRLRVDQSIFVRHGFEADGEVRLSGVHVGGSLRSTSGKFCNEDGVALGAERIRVNVSLHWKPIEVVGRVSFAFASVGVWIDDETVLDTPFLLHGLRYDGLHPLPPDVTAKQRIAWLDRDPDGYSPQPFSQLAAIYRAEGHDSAARRVLVASQTRRRRQRSGWCGWAGRAWSDLLRITVGYGYYPWLALLWLVLLIGVGSVLVNLLPDKNFVKGADVPPFNSLLYTIDVLLPFIDLGYGRWVAVGAAQVVTVVLVVLGWVLATAVIAAFAGVLRRGD
jgi:hypothetical protein